MLLIDNLLITSLIPILLFEYFKEKSWLTSWTTSKVGLLIFQLSITEVSSALDHSNMWSSVHNGRQVINRFVCSAIFFVISCQFWVIKTLFGFKILFVISLISLQKICNRPSLIHCLNSDGTGDLSLLRYKPDFVTGLFVINELYCITYYRYLYELILTCYRKFTILYSQTSNLDGSNTMDGSNWFESPVNFPYIS